jgi:hypothetical protein
MAHYDQADTLSTDTSVAVSGTGGSSTPEAAAGNGSYSTWSWETILATVLDIPISDRSEVTGQPWLTVVQAGQPDPAAHQIWSASWNTKQKGGAGSSLQVYLNPELYVGGGAWDRFSNAPAQALSGSATSLPLVPPNFHAVQQALASVTAGFQDMSGTLDSLHHNLTTESSPFQGNAADVIAELVSDLHGATLSIYDQLSSPSYSNAVGAAGDAATTYLSAINSAYGAWSALPEHSPLGAVVQVLTDIATSDGNGGYTIPDPENTPFGDLTTPGAWAAVEQQAKNIWMGPLTGSSSDFGGLDQLGRSALSGLVDQYNTTAGVVTPVVGPAPPSTVQTPVGGPNGFGNGGGPQGGPASGNPPQADFATGGGGGGGALPSGATAPGGSSGTTTPGAVGPVPPPALFAQPGDTTSDSGATTPAPSGTPDSGSGSTQPGPDGLAVPIGSPSGPGTPILAASSGAGAGDEPGSVDAEDEPADLDVPTTAGVLSGAIGATPEPAGQPAGSGAAPAGQHREAHEGFSGTVGRGHETKGTALGRPDGGPKTDVDRASGTGANHEKAGALTAPAAGFSVGGGPHGSLLSRSAVPSVADKPPSVTSSQVNMQLTPGGSDGGAGFAQPGSPVSTAALAGTQGGSPGAGSLAGPVGSPLSGPVGGSSMAVGQPSPAAVGGAGGPLAGQGVQAGSHSPMMMPPRSGTGGAGLGGQDDERRAYLPEDEGYWGTGPGLPGPADRPVADEPDFDVPRVIVGIGAEAEPNANQETMSNWRMR